jgi:hypothetical protein
MRRRPRGCSGIDHPGSSAAGSGCVTECRSSGRQTATPRPCRAKPPRSRRASRPRRRPALLPDWQPARPRVPRRSPGGVAGDTVRPPSPSRPRAPRRPGAPSRVNPPSRPILPSPAAGRIPATCAAMGEMVPGRSASDRPRAATRTDAVLAPEPLDRYPNRRSADRRHWSAPSRHGSPRNFHRMVEIARDTPSRAGYFPSSGENYKRYTKPDTVRLRTFHQMVKITRDMPSPAGFRRSGPTARRCGTPARRRSARDSPRRW